ncbi:hypothetical protein K2X89_16745 [Myxococcota bacterium]|nr:hypothetical protein [Myxococcota bacterium]
MRRCFWILAAGVTTVAVQLAAADERMIQIDLSMPDVYELVQPLRRECIAEQAGEGRDVAEARASAPDCLRRRLLSAAELERQIRVFFPADLTPEELAFCTTRAHDGDSLLPCVQFWAKEAPAQAPLSESEMRAVYDGRHR